MFGVIYPSFLFVIFLVCTNKDLRLLLVSDEQINEYSAYTGRLSWPTEDLVYLNSTSLLVHHRLCIIHLGLQLQRLLQTEEKKRKTHKISCVYTYKKGMSGL